MIPTQMSCHFFIRPLSPGGAFKHFEMKRSAHPSDVSGRSSVSLLRTCALIGSIPASGVQAFTADGAQGTGIGGAARR
jgi:hypothetical protein